jgi:hypothetical protein
VSHDDFDFEPQRGLPAALPAGERLLWQGAPDWRELALHGYRVRAFAWYGAAVIAARAILNLAEGTALQTVLSGLAWPVLLLSAGLGLLGFIAWLAARTTVYSLTERRIVIRQGIAMPVTMNLPLSLIDGVSAVSRGLNCGDVALQLAPDERVSYLLLWPHVRPWQWRQPQPMLRALRDHEAVGALLVQSLQSSPVVQRQQRDAIDSANADSSLATA